MKKILLLLALIATVLFAYYCLRGASAKIEQDISNRVVNAFQTGGFSSGLQVKVDGRDVLLAGQAESEEEKANAEKLISSLSGVRVVDNQVKVQRPVIAVVENPSSEPEFFLEPVLDAATDLGVSPTPEMQQETDLVTSSTVDNSEEEASVSETEETQAPKMLVTQSEPEPVADACQGTLATILEKEKVAFTSGRSSIQSGSYGLLNRLANAAKNCKDSVIAIHGYTDSSGNLEANTKLSLNRAKSVGRYLISKGVTQEIRVVGNGSNDPIADNATPEGRAMNRRIEFKVFKK